MNQAHNLRCPLTGHRIRHDGWNAERVEKFLWNLQISGCVREAAFMAGMSKTSAYRLAKRSEEFAIAWDRALAKSQYMLGLNRAMRHGGRLL